jgi:7-carboxy-7-deazaguanine synthase (Cx14CxxC type)
VGTDGDGGGSFKNAVALAKAVVSYWPESITDIIHPYVICTGGEPLLQLDKDLIEAFHNEGVEVAIETNGTIPVPEGIDWVCVSPKSGSTVVVEQGDEIKLVYPQEGHQPSDFVHLNFEHFFLQPMFDEDENGHVKETIEYCLTHPRWSLSLQSHKLLGLQ